MMSRHPALVVASLVVSLGVIAIAVRGRPANSPRIQQSAHQRRHKTPSTTRSAAAPGSAEAEMLHTPPVAPGSPEAKAIAAMFRVREFAQAEISPDGKHVAWVESLNGPNGEPLPNSAIYVADLISPSSGRRISAVAGGAPHAEHDIAWSPDSKHIAFLSDAAKVGQLQLYVASATGGAAQKLTSFRGFLANPGWSPDGKTIAVLFTENAMRPSGPLVAETPDEGVVAETFYEQRLTLVDAAKGTARQISPADMYVYEYDWSPDGKRFITTAASGNGDDNWYIAGLYTIDAASGAPTRLYQPPVTMQIAVPRWSPDGNSVAFIGGIMSDEPIVGGDIYIVAATGGEERNLTAGMKATACSFAWVVGGRQILFSEYVQGQSGVAAVTTSAGGVRQLWSGAETIGDGDFGIRFSLAKDGQTTAVVRQSFQHPPEVWAGEIGNWKPVTSRNARLDPAWGPAQDLHWSSGNLEIQGWLTAPQNVDPTKKYPLVVRVHGGPAWAITPRWPTPHDYFAALPSQGFFLLQPNPRGSHGNGEDFTRANVKDMGYGDFRDIMAGVDEAITAAPIDGTRVGITGWSYGGYMSMWAVTQTNRFRAAVAGAGLANYQSYYGENGIDKWMIPYFGATVYDDPAVYAKSSPITFIKNAKTPTLIVVGDRDGECPPPQSYEFWHALKTNGTPTQFVIYPNEGHLFANPDHNRDVIVRTIAWFKQYL